jgi:hypothetical protein
VEYDPATTDVEARFSKANCRSIVARALGMGQPGTRAPHVAMSNGGKWMSSLDLYRSNPVLIVGERGHHWLDAGAQLAAEFGLDIHRVGADANRSAEAFLQAHGISETRAILIRPDGFVAWRSPRSVTDRATRRCTGTCACTLVTASVGRTCVFHFCVKCLMTGKHIVQLYGGVVVVRPGAVT